MHDLFVSSEDTERIELATAVTPTQPRHPVALAQQALTASAMSGGRFALGLGLSHKIVIEDMDGLSFDRPARTMREYLDVVLPLIDRRTAHVDGSLYRVNIGLDVPDAITPIPGMIAAMGPRMLGIAGAATDGTILWMTGPRTVEEYVCPAMRKAPTPPDALRRERWPRFPCS